MSYLLYLEHKTNDWVRSKINFLVGPQEPLLATVKRQKLAWLGHVTRYNSLSKTIPLVTLEAGRRRGRQRKYWMDNVKEWTSLPMPELLTMAFCRKDWKRISDESSLMFSRRSNRSRDWIEVNWTTAQGDLRRRRRKKKYFVIFNKTLTSCQLHGVLQDENLLTNINKKLFSGLKLFSSPVYKLSSRARRRR